MKSVAIFWICVASACLAGCATEKPTAIYRSDPVSAFVRRIAIAGGRFSKAALDRGRTRGRELVRAELGGRDGECYFVAEDDEKEVIVLLTCLEENALRLEPRIEAIVRDIMDAMYPVSKTDPTKG
jgi:hypothetical protein